MRRYSQIAALVGGVTFATSGSAAYWPDSCGFAENYFGETGVSEPRSAGPGLVVQESFSAVINGWDDGFRRVTYTECSTGRQIDLFLHIDGSGPDWASTEEYAAKTEALLGKFDRKADSLSVQEVAEAAWENKIYTRTNTVPIETCGCSRLFPDLRGGKAKYEGTQ